MADIIESLKNLNNLFPLRQPSAFDVGIAEQLKEIAAQIEDGTVKIAHFSITMKSGSSRQKLRLEVTHVDDGVMLK